jgi:hypothetical protein
MTTGLLASAMLRSNHAVFMKGNLLPGMNKDVVESNIRYRIKKTMDNVIEKYKLAINGELNDIQILEEFTGEGFYSPVREESYTDMIRQTKGMLELAIEKINSISQDNS